MSFPARKQTGLMGEALVADHLKQQGFAILATNYRKRWGEVDIIARKRKVVAFVEVKLRTNAYFNISQVITPSKQQKIIKTAFSFIAEQQLDSMTYRFDVALLTKNETGYDLCYLENAFTSSENNFL